jgi:hypothetical protein
MKARILLTMLLPIAALAVQAQNPYLPLWEHVPDGEPRVFEDPDTPGKYRAYVIGSHDVTYTSYCGPDIRMWSAPVEDLTQWRDEGPIFTYYINGQWDTMFAPDLVEVRNPTTGEKTYYLYPHSRGNGRIGMVCKSHRPTGPFLPVNLSSDGTHTQEGGYIGFDPSVFVETIDNKQDPDYAQGYRAYVFYGFQHSTAYELDSWNMWALRKGTSIHDYFLPAGMAYGKVLDPEGTVYPSLYAGQCPSDFNFFEASSIRRVGNKYVMVFSGFSGPDYGMPSTNSALRYAYGDTPLGPWRSGGVLVDSRGVVPNEDGTHLISTNGNHNTHGSIQEINGQWYVFYHRPPRGYGYARQSMVAPVKVTWDKKKVADGGEVRIVAYDPYSRNHEHCVTASDGSVYSGAEVTSEGFQIFGLPPYRYYSAGYASYMSGNDWLQDSWDNWDSHMDLVGITDGGVVGFTYFGFGGLKKSQAGVPAFEGTKKGDNTRLTLFLTPGGKGAFKIHVMIDGPYTNAVWKGREIAVVEVPEGARKECTPFKVSVPAVEGLKGKHAIYLVVEGSNPLQPQGLFSLQGIAFSKNGEDVERPVSPKITIKVDGKLVRIPETPSFFTNENGYSETNRYQVYAPLRSESKIEVHADKEGVITTCSPIFDGRATIRCTYKGQEKIFLLN